MTPAIMCIDCIADWMSTMPLSLRCVLVAAYALIACSAGYAVVGLGWNLVSLLRTYTASRSLHREMDSTARRRPSFGRESAALALLLGSVPS
jgi:hypothetical protein